jgi:hypothetical protein
MFYVENYVGCTLAIGNVKQACTSLVPVCASILARMSFSDQWCSWRQFNLKFQVLHTILKETNLQKQ